MGEKFIISSSGADNIFTPEKIKRMEQEAAVKLREEAIRSGDEAPYVDLAPEEPAGPDNTAAIKSASRLGLTAKLAKDLPKINWRKEQRKRFDDYKKQRKDIFE